TVSFALSPGGSFSWNRSTVELVDAQIVAYVASQKAKWRMGVISPENPWISTNQLPVNVNMNDVCNAYSDGDTTNFYKSGMGCENMGRIPDVVYHETGHTLHFHSIIQGVGRFDSSLSEGAADYFCATITGDPQMGRGFMYDDTP